MAAPECEREARKRRERRDSGCTHERKERRPHSEERPPPPPPPPPLHDYNRLESERRAERLSRARRPQYGGKRRRAPARITKHPKENDCSATDETRCITPPNFEYAVQKTQLSDEPETLDAGALQCQVNLVTSTCSTESVETEAVERVRRDERSVAPRHQPRRDQPCPETRLNKIQKKISVLKRSISKYESDYEAKNGCAITPNDRITDFHLTRMYESLRKLHAEKRCIKIDPLEYALKVQAAKQQKQRDEKLDIILKSDKPTVDVIRNIEEWLESCRQATGCSITTESNWTVTQLALEKTCMQKALLRLEAARGRPPAHSAERAAVKQLYNRYRNLKRCLAVYKPDPLIGSTNGELATIHEHEAMHFNSSVDSSSDSQEKPSDSSQDTGETVIHMPLSPPRQEGGVPNEEPPSSTSSAHSATSEEAPTNEGLHYLGVEDLHKALNEAKLQKCVLRRSIKEYEVSFELQNSRKAQRDDKKSHEDEYLRYKAVKARIKLLNALINKQKALS